MAKENNVNISTTIGIRIQYSPLFVLFFIVLDARIYE